MLFHLSWLVCMIELLLLQNQITTFIEMIILLLILPSNIPKLVMIGSFKSKYPNETSYLSYNLKLKISCHFINHSLTKKVLYYKIKNIFMVLWSLRIMMSSRRSALWFFHSKVEQNRRND